MGAILVELVSELAIQDGAIHMWECQRLVASMFTVQEHSACQAAGQSLLLHWTMYHWCLMNLRRGHGMLSGMLTSAVAGEPPGSTELGVPAMRGAQRPSSCALGPGSKVSASSAGNAL